ncbi:hypothetical protein B484DRAFT_460305 [Ochromonadaceae sp. CCMP2298]|nr:hypothetical protein B484DRAFT_460305 [Ochromonadaceae sp. CCMP2298]|eukprot:CAMPEP_0173211896 /NCGR_PEP_ID=MMETSP1141-20130122/24494_1 /TAXON_ID=483371 /ORGANISM="non described non described, Strain CCMP2298" /LENGTH=122 /DNA_ID=CAMNT_0014138845 /DNA_START=230 /DNA_END=598 /DNA_ORIENTATION=-
MTTLYEAFWLLAGAWNISIASVLWGKVNARDKNVRENQLLRGFVGALGVGYVMVGFFDWMWWLIPLGLVIKAAVVLNYFGGGSFDYDKMKPDFLTWIVLGDLAFVVCFGIIMGHSLARSKHG